MDAKFLVPYQTAQQLREKGYDVNCYNYYTQNGELYCGVFPMNNNLVRIGCCTAPTYHEVLDWLVEKGIRIEVRMAYHFREKQWSWCGYVYIVEDEDYETSQLADWCSTREEALNAGIIAALKKL